MSVITTPAGPIGWQILAIFQDPAGNFDPVHGGVKKYCVILFRDPQGGQHIFNHVPFPLVNFP